MAYYFGQWAVSEHDNGASTWHHLAFIASIASHLAFAELSVRCAAVRPRMDRILGIPR